MLFLNNIKNLITNLKKNVSAAIKQVLQHIFLVKRACKHGT